MCALWKTFSRSAWLSLVYVPGILSTTWKNSPRVSSHFLTLSWLKLIYGLGSHIHKHRQNVHLGSVVLVVCTNVHRKQTPSKPFSTERQHLDLLPPETGAQSTSFLWLLSQGHTRQWFQLVIGTFSSHLPRTEVTTCGWSCGLIWKAVTRWWSEGVFWIPLPTLPIMAPR